MKYKSKGGVKEPTGKQKRQMRKAARMKDKRRDDSGRTGRLRKKGKKPTGAIIEDSKEVKFGGPTKKMKKGGVPGSLKRAAKKTAKGKANIKKGMDMLSSANTTKETRKAGRTMARGIRQKKAGARKKANYEFRQSVKKGDVDAPMGPNIGNLGEGKRDKKFLGGRLAGAIKGFRGGKGQGLKARLAGAAKGAAGGGMLGRAIGAARGMRGAAGQGGGLRGMLKAGAQGAMQGAFGGGAQQNAAEAAPAEGMEEEMMYGGKLKDRRRMGGPGGCKKGEPCDQGGGGKRMGRTKRQRQMDRQYRRAERRRRRSRRRGR